MENWGLVTFRDSALLYNASASSESDKQWVAEVIAHELAHQWFGDLVTMEWWSDLWLNEGFAEFMEYRGTHSVEPTWFMSEQYVANELSRAMRADQSAFTHAIAVNVTDPEEIAEIFDDISYGKGASILGMLEAWLNKASGPTYFFDSLKKYIESHAYSNAETWELWKALSSDVDVGSVMSTWTDQPGFPVAIIEDNNVSQERFYISAGVPIEELQSLAVHLPKSQALSNHGNQTWTIPLIYSIFKSENDKMLASEPKTILIKEKGPVQIVEKLQPGEFILANYGRSGVYRVQYPLSTYRFFSEALQKNVFFVPAVDRAGMLADAFALSWSGRIQDISVPFNLTRFLNSESDTVVWWAALAELSTLRAALVLSPAYGRFQSYYLKLVTKITTKLGWTETSGDKSMWHIRALLRAQAFVKAIELNDQKEVKYALEQFAKLKQGQLNSELSVDMYDAIYQAAAQWGTEEDYEWLLMKYKTSTFATEKGRLLNAFTSTTRPYLQIRTLDLVLSGDIRKQDIAS
jgi:aminopeptidase N